MPSSQRTPPLPGRAARSAWAAPAPEAPQAAAAAIELLRGDSLVTLAQRELQRRIVGGEFAAGTKLNEVEVAASFGVSRGPVREAFRALGQMGLVRVEKNRGVFVREVSLEEAGEFYEVRAALEGLIGRLAARRVGAGEVEALRGVIRRMRQLDRPGPKAAPASGAAGGAHNGAQSAARSGAHGGAYSGAHGGGASASARAGPAVRKAESYFVLNVEFHDLLARAARNQALLANYRGVVNQLDLYRRATLTRGSEHIAQSTAEHEAIVEAVASRDEARAERLLVEHVLGSHQRAQQALGVAAPPPSPSNPTSRSRP